MVPDETPAAPVEPAAPLLPAALDASAAPVQAATRRRRARRSVLPGFGLAMGFTLLYLSFVILIPLSTVVLKSAELTWEAFWRTVSSPRALYAYRLSLVASGVAALVNGVFGVLVAWVLERYRFPGKRLVDALVDLPFALPTAVAGIALASIYAANGWVGQWLAPFGIKVAYTPLGVVVALTFIGLPFVVRTVQPVLSGLDPAVEEAASTLGASRGQIFRRVIFPEILPAAATGFVRAFARALGEYGSLLLFAGGKKDTTVASILIGQQIETGNESGAAAISIVLLLMALACLFVISLIQRWGSRHERSQVNLAANPVITGAAPEKGGERE
jgi:sulfate/thiosulfate transport system permease protein